MIHNEICFSYFGHVCLHRNQTVQLSFPSSEEEIIAASDRDDDDDVPVVAAVPFVPATPAIPPPPVVPPAPEVPHVPGAFYGAVADVFIGRPPVHGVARPACATGRGRGHADDQGRGCGRGRAGVQGRGGGARRWGNPPMVFQSNNEPDVGNVISPFTPSRPPGFHLEGPLFRNTMRTAFEFFQLFFLLVKW